MITRTCTPPSPQRRMDDYADRLKAHQSEQPDALQTDLEHARRSMAGSRIQRELMREPWRHSTQKQTRRQAVCAEIESITRGE